MALVSFVSAKGGGEGRGCGGGLGMGRRVGVGRRDCQSDLLPIYRTSS